MSGGKAATVRAVALSGPSGAGKTTLLEAMLNASGRLPRRGSVSQGTSVGDATEEARARGLSTELNVAGFDYLGDRFVVLDCPGSVDFAAEADTVLPLVDGGPRKLVHGVFGTLMRAQARLPHIPTLPAPVAERWRANWGEAAVEAAARAIAARSSQRCTRGRRAARRDSVRFPANSAEKRSCAATAAASVWRT